MSNIFDNIFIVRLKQEAQDLLRLAKKGDQETLAEIFKANVISRDDIRIKLKHMLLFVANKYGFPDWISCKNAFIKNTKSIKSLYDVDIIFIQISR